MPCVGEFPYEALQKDVCGPEQGPAPKIEGTPNGQLVTGHKGEAKRVNIPGGEKR